MTMQKARIAVFVSGQGTNLRALLAHERSHPDWPVEIVLVVSDKPDCPALAAARFAGVNAVGIRPADFPDKRTFESNVLSVLYAHDVTGIALAGYMRIVGATLLSAFPDRIVNIHPSLLPQFPGKNAVAMALAAGASETGVTIHLVDAGIDTGRIIYQERVSIEPEMTEEALLASVHAVEHRVYPKVLGELARTWTAKTGEELT